MKDSKESLVGEKIVYDIKKLGLTVGEATLSVKGHSEILGQDAFLIVFTAKALNFYDEENIYLHPETYYPIIVKRNVNIFGSKEKIVETYHHDQGVVKIQKLKDDKLENMAIEKEGPIENLYGFIYRFRKSNGEDDDKSFAVNLPTKNVEVEFVEDDVIKAAGREYETRLFESEPKQFSLWFDKSDRQVPVRIKGAVGMGSATMVLKSYSEPMNGHE